MLLTWHRPRTGPQLMFWLGPTYCFCPFLFLFIPFNHCYSCLFLVFLIPFSVFNTEFKSDMTSFYLAQHNPTTVWHNHISVENNITNFDSPDSTRFIWHLVSQRGWCWWNRYAWLIDLVGVVISLTYFSGNCSEPIY